MPPKKSKTKKSVKKVVELEAFAPRAAAWLAMNPDHDAVKSQIASKFKISQSDAETVLKLAKERLAFAADVDLRLELGTRREQLNDLLNRARDAGDLRVELATLQELSKLSNVYAAPVVFDSEESVESPVEALARKHLESLDLAPAGLPLEELARRVAGSALDKGRDGLQLRLRAEHTGTRALSERGGLSRRL